MERGISALGSDCEEPGPSCDPGRDRCWFGGGGDGGGFVLGEQAQELHRLGAKPATDLNAIFCFFFFFFTPFSALFLPAHLFPTGPTARRRSQLPATVLFFPSDLFPAA